MIELQNVDKTYPSRGGAVRALRNVTLRVTEGEFVAVMGPSGSGKSTLLTVLGAMNPPSSGRVMIDDVDVYALKHEQQADFRHEYIGFVFQQLQLLPYLSALENVALPLAVASPSRRARIETARRMLHHVGLEGLETRMAGELSGGEQGRVAVARAMVNDPPLLLADEPTGSLDRATSTRVLELLHRLNTEGQTAVMVTHDPLAASYASRVVGILDGRVQAAEKPESAPGVVPDRSDASGPSGTRPNLLPAGGEPVSKV